MRRSNRRWRLFFEYAEDGASKVGIASAPAVDGPWTVLPAIFDARPGCWDGWHLSPGPLLCSDPMHPVMFYNGATRDAKWRIGWIAFAASAIEESNTIYLYYSIADKAMMRAQIERVTDA